MATAKTYTFPVGVRWLTRRLTKVSVPGKHDLRVATPPEFRGGIEGVWSPEDLLVASAASCYAVTLLAMAERRGVPLRALDVGAVGEVGRRDDGQFGFVEVVLDVHVRTDPGEEDAAKQVAEDAEDGCLVAQSLGFPVRVHVEVDRPAAALAS
jgi:organic hydroperoxide reductase OsmC/OhrA